MSAENQTEVVTYDWSGWILTGIILAIVIGAGVRSFRNFVPPQDRPGYTWYPGLNEMPTRFKRK